MEHGKHVIMACRRLDRSAFLPGGQLRATASCGVKVSSQATAKAMSCPMACRCEEARAELMSRSLPGTCECSRLDLADYSSVRSFAAATRHSLQEKKERLALLVNNAGACPTAPA